jgi:hypothetical protein
LLIVVGVKEALFDGVGKEKGDSVEREEGEGAGCAMRVCEMAKERGRRKVWM